MTTRNFLRTDWDVGVGPTLERMTSVHRGEVIHLDLAVGEEAKMAEDISQMPGWVEVDGDGKAVDTAVDRSRTATATPVVTPPETDQQTEADQPTEIDQTETEPDAG